MYTWNKKWINLYESPWGIVNKFMYSNSIRGKIAATEITNLKSKKFNVYKKYHSNIGIVSNYQINDNILIIGDKTIIEYGNDILSKLLQGYFKYQGKNTDLLYLCNTFLSESLRFCPECIRSGNHFMHHQFIFMKQCLVHKTDIINRCPTCNEFIPYMIKFHDSIDYYQCNKCKSYLFNDDDFGNILDVWIDNRHGENFSINEISNEDIPFIITNNEEQINIDDDINNYLFSRYTKDTNLITPKYIVKKGYDWQKLKYNELTINYSNKVVRLCDYAYLYAYRTLSRHITKSKKLGSKLCKAEEFIRNYCLYYNIMNQTQIEYGMIKCFDKEAIILYLWKRDMEYNSFSKQFYTMNKKLNSFYSYEPDYEILDYMKKIDTILPEFIDDSYKFSILVHFSMTLLKIKYDTWSLYINELCNKYSESKELMKKLSHKSLRSYSKQYNKHFLLEINRKKQIYKIFYSI